MLLHNSVDYALLDPLGLLSHRQFEFLDRLRKIAALLKLEVFDASGVFTDRLSKLKVTTDLLLLHLGKGSLDLIQLLLDTRVAFVFFRGWGSHC